MNTWETIFSQSPANNGYYKEDELMQGYWQWPRGTWLQSRLEYVREHEPAAGFKPLKKMGHAHKGEWN